LIDTLDAAVIPQADSPEPHLAKLRTEYDEPQLTKLNAERLSPNLANDLIEIADAPQHCDIIDTSALNKAQFVMEIPEDNLANDRTLTADPILRKSNAEVLLPSLQVDLTERDEPSCTLSLMDNMFDLVKVAVPVTVKLLPMRTKDLILTDDPRCK